MVLSCAIKNCPAHSSQDCDIKFHLFPTGEKLRLNQKWIGAVSAIGFHSKRSPCVCNEHFYYTDYPWSPIDNKLRLKRGAVP